MPSADQLPADIQALAHRNAHEVSDHRWSYDTERLVEAIERITGKQRSRRFRMFAVAVCLILALSGIVWRFARRSTVPPNPGNPTPIEESAAKMDRAQEGAVDAGRPKKSAREPATQQESTEEVAYRKALADLDSLDISARIAAIRSLERLARNSDNYYSEIIQTLTQFVRQRAPWKPEESMRVVDKDVQEVLTVLGRRRKLYGTEERRRLDLSGIEVSGADLREAHFEGANLQRSNLRNVNFWSAHLQGADMGGCDLRSANLELANLEGASLWASHIVPPIRATNLAGAILTGANITKANLEAAILHGAVGLTHEQLRSAIINENTSLPDSLRAPVRPPGR